MYYRGFYSLEILRQLENYTGKRIVDMFDVICGVSAGALVCTLLGASNLTISQCEERFRKFSKQMFSQSRVPGISKLISKHSYYNTQLYEEVLRSVRLFSRLRRFTVFLVQVHATSNRFTICVSSQVLSAMLSVLDQMLVKQLLALT